MKETPTISVIMPCYNQALFMPEALQSLLDQEYQDWECIIVNDGSPDNTEEVAKQWVEKDGRFHYYYKENSGVCDTRNYAVNKARGKYIVALDGDDKLAPKYFAEAVQILDNQPHVRVVYSNSILFGARNAKQEVAKFEYQKHLFDNQIYNSACVRKSIFVERGGYNLNMANGLEDWELWINLVDANEHVAKLDGYHYYYRIKEVSRSTEIDEKTNEDLIMQLFRNHSGKYLNYLNPIRNKLQADQYSRLFHQLNESQEMKVGRRYYFFVDKIRKLFGLPKRLQS